MRRIGQIRLKSNPVIVKTKDGVKVVLNLSEPQIRNVRHMDDLPKRIT